MTALLRSECDHVTTTLASRELPAERTPDAAFAKYAAQGAYHWAAIGKHPWRHHAFTAERYRLTLRAAGRIEGLRVLDYGCGDGALLGLVSRAVGTRGEAHGFDPSEDGLRLARVMLDRHGLPATLWVDPAQLPRGRFDRILCAEVIEHVSDIPALLAHFDSALAAGGQIVVTTPVRMTEKPGDTNHVQEWFPGEFRRLFESGPFELVRHETAIPAAAAEVYSWRPWLTLRFPVFRVICNLLSIAGFDALAWLKLRPMLHMQQLVVLRRRSESHPRE